MLAFLAGCGDRPATGPPESFVWLAFRERGERRGGDLVVFRPSVAGWEEAVLETFDEGGATSFGVGMRAFPDGSTRAWHGRRLWRSRDGGRSWEEIASPVQPIDPSLGRDSSIVEVVPGPNGEAWLAHAVQLEILPSLVVGVSREIDPGGFRVVPLADPPYASWDPTRRFAMGSRDGRLEIVRQPVEDGFLRSPYEGPVIEVPGEGSLREVPAGGGDIRYATAEDRGWLLAGDELLRVETDAIVQLGNPATTRLRRIDFVDRSRGLACGPYECVSTTTGGDDWRLTDLPVGSVEVRAFDAIEIAQLEDGRAIVIRSSVAREYPDGGIAEWITSVFEHADGAWRMPWPASSSVFVHGVARAPAVGQLSRAAPSCTSSPPRHHRAPGCAAARSSRP